MESRPRHTKLVIGLAVAVLILLGRLFYIQIINDRYKRDALNNSIVYETIYPPRGIIHDRNGEILVGNATSYDIMVTPREISSLDTLRLAEVLGVDMDFMREKLDYYRTYRSRIGFKTLTFIKNVDAATYMRFAEMEYLFPGFKGQVRTIRTHPFNAGGNLLGYISEVDGDYIRKHPEYRAGDDVGRTGLEAAREEDLRGSKGYHIYLRDSRNRVLTSYNNGEDDLLAVPGKDITTTIDAHLQQYGQQLMQNKKGSLIAIEPSTGEILAMVTSPGIDVDVLSDMGKNYAELAANPDKPMFNRPVQASYPPGSVFKLVNGLIGMQEGVLEPWMKYPCSKGYQYTSTRKLGCHSHKSPLDFDHAVMTSCNAYFCYVFKSILENPAYSSTKEAYDRWEQYVRSFGFGSPLGLDYPGELGGSVPKSSRYDKIYGKNHWRFTSVVSLSIGQGELLCTPLQIANLCATIANRGWYITPHIIKDSEDLSIDDKYREKHYTEVDAKHFEKAVKGMSMAVNGTVQDGATGTMARIPGVEVCGKTGTAENPHGADHSVFICFAPRENPQIAVAAYIENAGFGGTWACPIASLLAEKYRNGEIDESRKWGESRAMEANLMNVQKKEKKTQ